MEVLVRELESLIEELQKHVAGFVPASVTPAQLVEIFNRRVGQYAPESQRECLPSWSRTWQEVSFRDLTDLNTDAEGVMVHRFLSGSEPGLVRKTGCCRQGEFAPRCCHIAAAERNLEGTSTSDLLDPQTWQGLWYILNYTAHWKLTKQCRESRGAGKIANQARARKMMSRS